AGDEQELLEVDQGPGPPERDGDAEQALYQQRDQVVRRHANHQGQPRTGCDFFLSQFSARREDLTPLYVEGVGGGGAWPWPARRRCAAIVGVVVEATGGYESALVDALQAAEIPVARVNPRQVRDFARATGQLAKTDRLDARVLAAYGAALTPAPLPRVLAQSR